MTISKLEYEDLEIALNLMQSETYNHDEFVDQFNEHCDSGLSYKALDDNGEICCLVMMLDKKYFYSLSFYVIRKDIRGNLDSLMFYRKAFGNLKKDKPIYIKSEDISTFERMVLKISDGRYMFTGLKIKGIKHG